jgi:hypothetical protein
MDLKKAMLQKGVLIPNPESVEIGDDINIERIASEGVTIHSGCKLLGAQTFLAKGAQIGFEGPVTIDNCYVGSNVALKSGFFQEAVFLENATCSSSSHVRRGTIMEEGASVAHTVGLKQTILFPYVTLGSLINFCDCFMAGGTGRSNHSEVGSSYIHFNFTPNQDKATPSLMGDVPRGVMLNQSPIFLGGQGGLVGPCRLAYGTVVAAGTICRKDQIKEDCLVMESTSRSARIPYKPGRFRDIRRVLIHNIHYIGQLLALNQWYREVRRLFVGPKFAPELLEGLIRTLEMGIEERVVQLEKLGDIISGLPSQMPASPEGDFFRDWREVKAKIQALHAFEGDKRSKDSFLEIMVQQAARYKKDYLAAVAALKPGQSGCGSRWLQSVVDYVDRELSPG